MDVKLNCNRILIIALIALVAIVSVDSCSAGLFDFLGGKPVMSEQLQLALTPRKRRDDDNRIQGHKAE